MSTDLNSEPQASDKKIIFLLNDERNVRSVLKHLQGVGYEIRIAHHLGELIKSLEIFEPRAIMMSWNLKRTNVRLMYKLLSEKLGIPCIVFAEELGTKTAVTLMNSGILNHMLAPVSGGAVHTKIEALLHGPVESKSDVFHFDKLIVVQPDDIPGSTSWELAQNQKITIGEHTIWRGTYHDKKTQTKKMYYFKGPQAPSFDDDTKKWSGFENGSGPILMQERPQSDAFNMIQSQAESKILNAIQEGTVQKEFKVVQSSQIGSRGKTNWKEAVQQLKTLYHSESSHQHGSSGESLFHNPSHDEPAHDIESTKTQVSVKNLEGAQELSNEFNHDPVTEGSDSTHEGSNPGIVISKSTDGAQQGLNQGQSSLTGSGLKIIDSDHASLGPSEDKKKSILEEACSKAFQGGPSAIPEGDYFLHVTHLKTSRFCGFIILGLAAKNDQSSARSFSDSLEGQLKTLGEPLLESCIWGTGWRPLGQWNLSLLRQSQFALEGQLSGQNAYCWFIQSDVKAQMAEATTSETIQKNLKPLDVIKNLRPNVTVDFDVYLDLEINKKTIHYLKSGTILTEKAFEKLSKHKTHLVYLPADQAGAFWEYFFFNFIISVGSGVDAA
ncbi:MAG: hypothetical protein IT289_06670 [Oligoflexia bacterium]|nr:hypothetical protein [Oligoflexia bacterium]